MRDSFPSFYQAKPQGEAALLFYLGVGINPILNTKVRLLVQTLNNSLWPGIREITAAYCCLQVQFDPLITDHEEVKFWIIKNLSCLDKSKYRIDLLLKRRRIVELPIVYGGDQGPDLKFICDYSGFKPEEVIARHSNRDYLCYLVGFTPGFPYLGELDIALATPRLDYPRFNLPIGAVGIGASQTGLYPLGGPGGWHIIGRSTELLYNPYRSPICLVEPGDLVRFKQIDTAIFPDLQQSKLVFNSNGISLFEVLNPGLFTTIQDKGRWGWQHLGIPISGALDSFNLVIANLLLGNPPNCPALELTLLGPTLKTLNKTIIVVTGANLNFRIDGQPAQCWVPITILPNQILEFGIGKTGSRAILAVINGFAIEPILGSASTFIFGRLGAQITKGAILKGYTSSDNKEPIRQPLISSIPAVAGSPFTLRAIPGPNQNFFSENGLHTFFNSEYKICPQTDRRGIQLKGPTIEFKLNSPASIISEPNTPGIIQVPPNGIPIILLNEQTVGGYAKIATIIGPDRDALALALPGDIVRFQAITSSQGVKAARYQASCLKRIIK